MSLIHNSGSVTVDWVHFRGVQWCPFQALPLLQGGITTATPEADVMAGCPLLVMGATGAELEG